MRYEIPDERTDLMEKFEKYIYLDDNLDFQFVEGTPKEAVEAYEKFIKTKKDKII